MAKKPEGWKAPYPGPAEPEVYRFEGPWPGTVRPGVDAPVEVRDVAVVKVAKTSTPAAKPTKKAAKARKATKKG